MNDPVRPDEVIPPDGGSGGLQLRGMVKDLALLLPNFLKLLGRLLRDPRVPRRSKLLIGAVLAYLASPVDLIPDFVPVAGFADDILLTAYAVNHLIDRAGEEVVLDHWDGPADMLEMVRSVLGSVGELMPSTLRRWVDRLAN
ncbi:MAG TPA: YkvA family protein [Acidimicrobiia bacterium]|jgi:uncharacterized membrane protein YkvA (DUF1232 family)|nr:YkvA family protein [Acidimicrobiia bacterium]